MNFEPQYPYPSDFKAPFGPLAFIQCFRTANSGVGLPVKVPEAPNADCSSPVDDLGLYSAAQDRGDVTLLTGYSFGQCHIGSSLERGLLLYQLQDIARVILADCSNKTTVGWVHGFAHFLKPSHYVYLGGEFQPIAA